MSKLRTIQKAYEYVKEQDPNSDVTMYMIRKLAEQEKVSIAKSGRKVLIDVDSLMDLLSGKEISPSIINII